jgi:hypothetical protein
MLDLRRQDSRDEGNPVMVALQRSNDRLDTGGLQLRRV